MTISNIVVSSITQTTAHASWNNSTSENINYSLSGPGTNGHSNLTNFSVDMNSLVPNSTYTITITGVTSGSSASTSFTTLSPSTHLSLNSATNTSLNIHAASNYFGANTFDWYLNNVYQATVAGTNDGTGYYLSDYTFTGLNAGTSFNIGVHVYLSGTDVEQGSGTFTTTNSRPPAFDWLLPKTSGSTMQIGASEWGLLQSNVNQVRSFKGLSAYAFTTMNVGDQANASWIFNQVINAISPMNSSVLPTVGTSTTFNDSVLFSRIRNSLNAIS